MMLLELDLAIYKALTGYPLDGKGRPLIAPDGLPDNRSLFGAGLSGRKPSYGMRIPMLRGSYDAKRGLTSQDPDAVRIFKQGFDANMFRQVPVFDENIEGRAFDDIWPCVTFRQLDLQYNTSTYVAADPFQTPDPASPVVTVTNARGEVVVTGRENNIVRPHPESFDVTYVVTAHSKSRMEMELIANQILNTLPGRTGLEVEYQNGSTHICDMLLQEIVNYDLDGNMVGMSASPDEQRYYARGFVYLIEAYFDNTTNEFGITDSFSTRAITQRLYELDNLQGQVLEIQYNPDDTFVSP